MLMVPEHLRILGLPILNHRKRLGFLMSPELEDPSYWSIRWLDEYNAGNAYNTFNLDGENIIPKPDTLPQALLTPANIRLYKKKLEGLTVVHLDFSSNYKNVGTIHTVGVGTSDIVGYRVDWDEKSYTVFSASSSLISSTMDKFCVLTRKSQAILQKSSLEELERVNKLIDNF